MIAAKDNLFPRGAFLGYIALGEGGGLFFAADGCCGTPSPDAVLTVLAGAAGAP